MVDGDDTCPFYNYILLALRIQDSSGKDLIKGIEYDCWDSGETSYEEFGGVVKKNLYTLDFVFPNPSMSPYESHKLAAENSNNIYNQDYSPTLSVSILDGIYSLKFMISSNKRDFNGVLPPAEKVTIKLSLPYVFGDDSVHEIVTFWEPYEENPYYQLCNRLEFAGKECVSLEISSCNPDNNIPVEVSAFVVITN